MAIPLVKLGTSLQEAGTNYPLRPYQLGQAFRRTRCPSTGIFWYFGAVAMYFSAVALRLSVPKTQTRT
jgi:hypothetical protein